ncbi:uncharacterized protein LOC129779996 [Toxorhynchites rutilus septentrionalis]|uniref:uncharacterized protein LOC129779996 n=1 Tax=Toxorhynchites rutilus septentrionalis TaxID=329112 RepID=UPI00247ADC73|nr:uncharacterized protein LOC129779996 [Toxorhynchites rutilus septentrionalis]
MESSRNIDDSQELLSLSEVYEKLLHAAREADRQYVLSRSAATEDDDEDDDDDNFDSFKHLGSYYEDELYIDAPGDEDIPEPFLDWDAPLPSPVQREMDMLYGSMDSRDRSGTSRGSEPSGQFVLCEEELLEDSYFPGCLDDIVQGKLPFSGEVAVQEGDESSILEMSVLEAFDRRVEHDQQKMKERIMGYYTLMPNMTLLSDLSFDGEDDGEVSSKVPIQDGDLRAAIDSYRVDNRIQNIPETELTKAIDSLTKAEVMYEYQCKHDKMSEMSKRVIGDLSTSAKKDESQAAPIGHKYPKFEVISIPDGNRPLEIISYIGSTRNKLSK